MSIVVYETEFLTHSDLLGPNGKPLAYQPRQKVGFDLTPKAKQPEQTK
ncbi:hypothetical protein [Phaeobacter inhibens]|nr:hypothetical protein [Phaeobacter inhibens]AUR08170.1 hypothetical protein PhaeoP59_01999 [Phaeobacter inhibens]